MSKVAQYLQDHLVGDVSTTPDMRQFFATDASALKQIPQIVVSPKNEQDVRKVTRFAWQLAERGKLLPIVSRGSGTDMGGAAIGQTITMVFPPHMNRVIEFDDRKGTVVVEPGTNFGRLQHILSFSHGRYIPSYPSSYEYSTIGGAASNNSGGERSLVYGPIGNYVEKLRLVLANGEVLETGRISRREVNKRMGMSTFEGEIYRAIDALLNENEDIIKAMPSTKRPTAGYDIKAVRDKDGSVDLTPLIVGSQGTLGVITSLTMTTEVYRADITTVIIGVKDRTSLQAVSDAVLANKPLSSEYFDASLLQLARKSEANYLHDVLGEELPSGVIIADFDFSKDKLAEKLLKKLQKKLHDFEPSILVLKGEQRDVAARLKRLTHVLLTKRFTNTQLVPGIDDAMVPADKIAEFMTSAEELFKKQGASYVYTARLGEGIIHAYPLVDLTQLGDRQRLFRLIDEYYKLVLASGGSVTAEHGDGRIRGSYLKTQLGDVVYDLMHQIKLIFDPYNIMNPGVKMGVEPKTALPMLRQEYEVPQLYNH